jgi:glycosyltransferase involved in cell wall biosynthesis
MSKTKNILILTYWDFNDALVQTYTLPYVQMIADTISSDSQIYLLTLNKKNSPIVFQHPKIKIISFRYIPFGLFALLYYSWMLLYLLIFIVTKNITHLHAWCTPAGVFGYILSVLTKKPLTIDSYEPHAEAMVEVGEWKTNSFAFQFLFFFEKKMTRHALYLIATTEKMIKEYAVSRYGFDASKNNWFVKSAGVNIEVFKPDETQRKSLRQQLGIDDKIVGIYAGKFGGIYLEQEFFEWLRVAHQYWKEKFVLILLSSHTKEYIHENCRKYNIPQDIILHYYVPHKEVVKYLNIADFAITPVKPVYTKKFCSPIKDGEYWAMGLPVIITNNISDDSEIIEKNNIGYVLKHLNENEYLHSVKIIDECIQKPLRHKIIQVAQQYRDIRQFQQIYHAIYS